MTEKPAYTWRDFVRAMANLLRPQGRKILWLLLFLTLQLAYALLFPLGLQSIFDRALPQRNVSLLLVILAVLSGGFVLSLLATALQERMASAICAESMRELRERMFGHLQSLSTAYYQRTPKGELLSRFSNDLQAIEQTVSRGFSLIVFNLLLLVASIVLLFVVEWRLALITLILSPVLTSGPNLFGPRANKSSYTRKEHDAVLFNVLQEQVTGHQVIQAYGLEASIAKRFWQRLDEWRSSTFDMHYLSALMGVASYAGVLLLILLIVGLGGYWSIQGAFSAGGLVAFVGLLLNIDEATRGLNQSYAPLLQSMSGMQRVGELMAEPQGHRDKPDAIQEIPTDAPLRLADVTFGYESVENPQIRGLSLAIERGRSVAFVGPSGSGKSTVLKLLTRTYDPQQGQVMFGDVDLLDLGWDAMHHQFGVVFQHTFLFQSSIRDNIRQGRPSASDQEVEDAAKAAELHELIMQLPDGYDSMVGEDGSALSGGQRQRVAIARMLLRDPPILMLDEATSALDPASEAAINETLRRAAQGRTAVSVTHRLASVVDLDWIYVMDQGRLAEEGTHASLLQMDGVYAQLWQKQSGFSLQDGGQYARVDAARLQQIPLLKEVPLGLLEPIAQRFETEHFVQEATIILQGQQGEKFYILIRGRAEVWLEQGEAPLSTLEIGDYFGEIALLSNSLTTATVKARTACSCLSLTRNQFHNLLADLPALKASIAPLMAARFAQLQGSSVDIEGEH